jgi:hypothetical protein
MNIHEYAATLAREIRELEHARKTATGAQRDRIDTALSLARGQMDSFVEFAGSIFTDGAERI